MFALLLAGCGPREGEVVDREFEPMRTYTYNVDIYDGSSRYYDFMDGEWKTKNHYHTEERVGAVPDRWFVTIQLGVGDGAKRNRFEVPQRLYNQATNGTWYRHGFGLVEKPALEK